MNTCQNDCVFTQNRIYSISFWNTLQIYKQKSCGLEKETTEKERINDRRGKKKQTKKLMSISLPENLAGFDPKTSTTVLWWSLLHDIWTQLLKEMSLSPFPPQHPNAEH